MMKNRKRVKNCISQTLSVGQEYTVQAVWQDISGNSNLPT